MLSLDNKPFEIPEDFIKMIKNDKKKQFVFKISKTKISWDKKNKRWNKPASETFDPFYEYKTTEGTGWLRYYTTVTKREHKDSSYLPVHFSILNGNDTIIPAVDLQKLFFYYNSPNNESNPDFENNNKLGIFYLEDKIGDARSKVKKATTNRKAMALIYEKLDRDQLIEVALACNIPNASSLETEEIQVKLDGIVNYINPVDKNRDSAQEFIDKIKTTNIKLQAEIQTALDKKVIQKMPNGWHWKEGAKLGKQMCKIRGNEDPFERLEKYLSSEDGREDLQLIRERMGETQSIEV